MTSEPSSFLPKTRKLTGYEGEAISDPKNELAAHLKQKGFLDVAISEKKGYEFGMAQPAFLVLDKEGTVWERWAIVPSLVSAFHVPFLFTFPGTDEYR